MKNIAKYLGIASLAVLMAGCTDEDLFENKMPVSGEEVVFGSQVEGYSLSKQGRTVYGVDSDWGGDLSGVDHLLINWVDGDKVWIGCEQAMTGYQQASYQVDAPEETLEPGDKNHNTSLLVKLGDTGIRWGDATQEHKFYAFYPQDKMVKMEGSKVTLTIPQTQDRGQLLTNTNYPDLITDPNWKIVNPDMGFAMMVGWGKWTPGETETPEVRLNFHPITTVLDVLVNGPKEGTPMGVYSVMVQSDNEPIVGTFTVDIVKGGTVDRPAEGTNTTATIVCSQQKEDGTIEPVYLNPGEQLNLKFFLLPQKYDAGTLKVSVLTDGGQVLTKTLTPTDANGNTAASVTLKAGEITRVSLPRMKASNSSNWMSLINDNTYITQLSIPGAKHAYSSLLYESQAGASMDETTNMMEAYQSLNIDQLFDAGIRAFDIKVSAENDETPMIFVNPDVPDRENPSPSFYFTTFLDELKKKMDAVLDDNNKPTEGVVVSITYVDLYGEINYIDWANNVAKALSDWSDSKGGNQLVVLGGESTMGDLRGKIGVLLNVPGSAEAVGKNYNYGNIATLLESYTYFGNRSELQWLNNGEVLVQQLWQVNNPTIKDGATSEFAHHDEYGLLPYFATDPTLPYTNNALIGDPDVIQRKLDLVTEIFAQATEDNNLTSQPAGKTKRLYINDIGGYCVVKQSGGESTGERKYTYRKYKKYLWSLGWRDDEERSSFDYNKLKTVCTYFGTETPSSPKEGETWAEPFSFEESDRPFRAEGGNSALLASIVNPKVATQVYDLVANGKTPLGIVYMNFAGVDEVTYWNDTYKVGGSILPGMILSNNFKMQLEQKPTTGQ